VGWFVAALPPVSLVLGAEALRVMSRHIIEHGAILSSLAQLTGQEYEARRRLDTVSGQISTAQARLEAIKMDIQAGQTGQNAATVTDMNAARQALIETRRGEVLARFRAGEGVGDIAAALDVSARTVKRDIKMLNGKVGVAL
jgi:DNA-binding NarL/FixJ family response regulator